VNSAPCPTSSVTNTHWPGRYPNVVSVSLSGDHCKDRPRNPTTSIYTTNQIHAPATSTSRSSPFFCWHEVVIDSHHPFLRPPRRHQRGLGITVGRLACAVKQRPAPWRAKCVSRLSRSTNTGPLMALCLVLGRVLCRHGDTPQNPVMIENNPSPQYSVKKAVIADMPGRVY